MAKKATPPETPAAPPDVEATPVASTPEAWAPPPGHLVTDDRTFRIWVDGVCYEHVADAPDGRWIYRANS